MGWKSRLILGQTLKYLGLRSKPPLPAFAISNCKHQLRNLHVSSNVCAALRLTPQEVNQILQSNENSQELSPDCSVKLFDTNQLPSNDPIEDMRTEAQCLLTQGVLFGVFDGHAGSACAQVVAKRLFNYISLCLLSTSQLHNFLDTPDTALLKFFNERFEFVDVLRDIYTASLRRFAQDLLEHPLPSDKDVSVAFERSFLRLDNDLSHEVINNVDDTGINQKTLSVAMSGAVTCVAHVAGPHLHVASVGDCRVVLGRLNDRGSWTPKVLSVEHNTENISEVLRIKNEHPKIEQDSVIKFERLLGQLAPLRAFGDYRYKWSKELLEKHAAPHLGPGCIPPNYYTPPYLTARPEVRYHHLTPKDKFLVIASDGLWDFISPLQVVRLVGEHMRGKTVLTPYSLPPEKDLTLSEINKSLLVRKESLGMRPIDRNAATHLIRNALGATEFGVDHSRLSQLLSLPMEEVRSFRDDITITVLYFDEEYLRQCMANT